MDKNAIKKYAVWARNELIARVSQKAQQYGITVEGYGDKNADSVNGVLLSATEKKQRQALIAKIDAEGFEQVMEEVAYTWFNRFTALRFMEVNNYLPSHTRVFTNEANEFKPQILVDAISLELEGLDMDKVFDMKNANKEEDLYKYLLIVQCNALSSVLPGMFQKIADYTELLLPDYLLREGSVIEQMISLIPEDNFDINTENGQIEIIGWLYQYYISEKHEKVVDPLHGKVVKKEEIPAATQLFTTDWVVRYIVDNSVGRYWIERNSNSKLKQELEYYVTSDRDEKISVPESIVPQDVSVFDPCIGSGHFAVYAFDVLMKIYIEYGYTEREAAAEIVQNNIFGLDIDGRAAQLAYFAIMMKARQYDRRFFNRGIQPAIYEIQESNMLDKASIDYFCSTDSKLRQNVEKVIEVLYDAKEYGSLVITEEIDFDIIDERIKELNEEINMFNVYFLRDFNNLINICRIINGKYAAVVTNPPYLNKYDAKLKDFLNTHYKDYSGDLFSVFIYRNFGFCKENGFNGLMTPFVWMFIKSYEQLRRYVINEKSLVSIIQMEYSAFEEATVPICSYILRNGKQLEKAYCFKLSDFKGGMDVQKVKTLEAIHDHSCGYYYEASVEDFKRIPGAPISFWVSEELYQDFDCKKIGDIEPPRFGMSTSDNNRFVRTWFEISYDKFARPSKTISGIEREKKWFPYNNGGEFRKWYGDNCDVVNWEDDGREIKGFGRAAIRNKDFYYRPGITWTAISSAKISVRQFDCGFLFSSAGFCIFEDNYKQYILALMNNVVGEAILKILSPTINFNVGDIAKIPVKEDYESKKIIDSIVDENVEIAKMDWDSFEVSWDFKNHPLVPEQRHVDIKLSEMFMKWQCECSDRFNKLKKNEEELNRLFISIYNLENELSPEVLDKDVSVRKADLKRDVKGLISYAVGCMFGRYSLDKVGLAFAGGSEWSANAYSTLEADVDNIIPICDDEYFNDDIVGKFIEFVKVVYGDTTLEENLQFIADAIGSKGQSREVIRNYFLNDFYADHIKMYQKRPIYWLFDSGKKNGFKCLIYMHRYQSDTVARIRTDYVHEQQSRYRTTIADLEQRITNASTNERVKLNKQLKTIQDQAEELRGYEEKIHHLADQFISIDLDDGVKANYAKFQDVLAKIK